jgi:o-succinylbenzoate synthase
VDSLKIKNIEIFRYRLPLHSQLPVFGKPIETRTGCLIQINSDSGEFGYGEIAPLPSLHDEDLEKALPQLKLWQLKLSDRTIPENLERLNGRFEKWFADNCLFPTVRFGIETAVLNLLAKSRKISLASLLASHYQKRVAVNGLVDGNNREILLQVSKLFEQGLTTIKMKVGRNSIDEDVEIIKMLNQRYAGEIKLRLDANRSWEYEDAMMFSNTINKIMIEYIEEPLKDFKLLEKYHKNTGIPVALDESLSEISPYALKEFSYATALVLKPSVIGGFEKCTWFIREGKNLGMYPVISCAFQSGVGLSATVNFAASLNPGSTAMGFGTMKWFKKDILSEPISIQKAELDADEIYNKSLVIDNKMLEDV